MEREDPVQQKGRQQTLGTLDEPCPVVLAILAILAILAVLAVLAVLAITRGGLRLRVLPGTAAGGLEVVDADSPTPRRSADDTCVEAESTLDEALPELAEVFAVGQVLVHVDDRVAAA